jgi:hypothetical protein
MRGELAQIRDAFIPRILLVSVDGAAATAAVWPDAIPSRLPRVDYLLIGRDELARRGLFTQKADQAVAPWSACEAELLAHGRRADGPSIELGYEEPPETIKRFVRRLRAPKRSVVVLAPDKVLDEELVRKYVC